VVAVIELYKQGIVDLEQFDAFGDLRVRRLREGETALDAASLAEWDEPESDRTAEQGAERETVATEPE
jgi:chromatin segregation and condensation protein Rec8/ScpA/Scc1 (kleisin family)